MRKALKILTISFLGVFVVAFFALADVMVSVNGDSNGVLLWGVMGPAKLGKLLTISRSGGSIKSARAKAIYTKYHVNIGNEVIAKPTPGDPLMTHVRAGSLFFGNAKVVATKPRAVIKNFKIGYKMNGKLKCKTPDSTVPKDYSRASAETLVKFNNRTKFAGSANQDGTGVFDNGKKDLAGQFAKVNKYQASINKTFPINLGTVRDGQKFKVLFSGDTLVSFGTDVPISYCEADFLNTSDFRVLPDQSANINITPAQKVAIHFDPDPFILSAAPTEFRVYVEASQAILKKIKLNTLELYERIGDGGSVKATSMEDIGDHNGNGKSDRAIVFDGAKVSLLLELANLGYLDEDVLFLLGESGSQTFFGKGILETQLQ